MDLIWDLTRHPDRTEVWRRHGWGGGEGASVGRGTQRCKAGNTAKLSHLCPLCWVEMLYTNTTSPCFCFTSFSLRGGLLVGECQSGTGHQGRDDGEIHPSLPQLCVMGVGVWRLSLQGGSLRPISRFPRL